ncbi:hypothetical protein LCGC14_2995950, partial [marine sediment metagenome]
MAFIHYYLPLDECSELCYYIEYFGTSPPSDKVDLDRLKQVLGDLRDKSTLTVDPADIFEIGPKMSFHTSWCS